MTVDYVTLSPTERAKMLGFSRIAKDLKGNDTLDRARAILEEFYEKYIPAPRTIQATLKEEMIRKVSFKDTPLEVGIALAFHPDSEVRWTALECLRLPYEVYDIVVNLPSHLETEENRKIAREKMIFATPIGRMIPLRH